MKQKLINRFGTTKISALSLGDTFVYNTNEVHMKVERSEQSPRNTAVNLLTGKLINLDDEFVVTFLTGTFVEDGVK